MKQIVITVLAAFFMGFSNGSFAEDVISDNLVPKKNRRVSSFNRNGRSTTIKVVPGKSYLIRAAVKLNTASTNPDTKIRFAIQEKGRRGVKVFEWYNINANEYTNMSAIYKVTQGVTEADVILNPHFTAEEKASYKDLTITEIDKDLEE